MADDMNDRIGDETDDDMTTEVGWVANCLWRTTWDATAAYTMMSFYDLCSDYVPTHPISVWLLGFLAAWFATIAATLVIGEIIEAISGGNYSLNDVPAPPWLVIVPACIVALVVHVRFPEIVGVRLLGMVVLGSFVAELIEAVILFIGDFVQGFKQGFAGAYERAKQDALNKASDKSANTPNQQSDK